MGVLTGPSEGSMPVGSAPLASLSRCCTRVRAKYTSTRSGNDTVTSDSPCLETERTPSAPWMPISDDSMG
jgi:hypothetical protein